MRKLYLLIPAALLCLTACGDDESKVAETPVPSSLPEVIRPSEAMGIVSSTYIAQGMFINVHSATKGIDTQTKILQGQQVPTTDETFQLLQDLGSILQVDFIDEMNRSANRAETLDTYVKTLKGVGRIADRKYRELVAKEDSLKDERRAQKKEVSNLEKEMKTILKNEDYARAGDAQKEVAQAQAKLSEIEATLEQTKDIIDRYESLLEITKERILAIQSNREVLIAGVKVREVPGIEELDIFDDRRSFSRSERRALDKESSDMFGNELVPRQNLVD